MIRLLYNYYEDKNHIRKKEIDFCLQKNLANPHINTIIVESPHKPKYKYLFDKINQLTGPDDINIICNSDIFFDETISLTTKMSYNDAWALCRWEWYHDDNIKFFTRPDSQDTWIFKGKIKDMISDFTLGLRGCDNRIAHEIQQAGYNISNPSLSVKTYHVHNSGIRNYSNTDVVPPPYLTLSPSSLV